MSEPQRAFRLQRLDRPQESMEEINERIAEILAEGLCSYLIRKGLLKHQDTESVLAHIEALRHSRPNYEAM